MKSSILVLVVALFLAIPFVASGQDQYFEAGKSYLGPSIGLSFLGSAAQFGVNYEYGMKMDFGMVGIGGVFRYWGYSDNVSVGTWKYSNILIGAQGNYHFKMDPGSKIDPWVGLVLGYDASSSSWTWASGYGNYFGIEPSSTSGGLVLNAQGGARYWISPTMAIRASIGYGSLSYGALDVGVDWKF